ncbi:TetR/AcrR family transcriptional regulator [Nocardiopsis oceani]
MPRSSVPWPALTTRIGRVIDTPRKLPHQQRSRETVDVLLEAAAQVFEAEGLDATTNRIAERAGYSVGTLYQYFPNKRALLYVLAERHLDEAEARLTALFARLAESQADWEHTVRAFAEEVVLLHQDRPVLHEVMHAHAPRVPEGVRRLQELHRTVAEGLTAHLRRCGRGGSDPERTAALLVHTADAQLHGVLLGKDDAAEALTRSLLALA